MSHSILGLKFMETLSLVAIKFSIMGDEFYWVLKNRMGETGVVKTITDMSIHDDNVLITNFNDLNTKQKENFINSLIETIS